MERRTLLQIAGLGVLAAACGTPRHPVSSVEGTTLTCPTVVAGSVSNQSGSVSGWTTVFVDGYGDRQGVDSTQGVNSQFQYPIVLSDKAGVGTRYQQNKVVKGEHWLLMTLVAGRQDSNHLPFPAPGTNAIGTNWNDGAGNTYQWTVTFVAKSTKNCNASETTATGGSISLTSIDETNVSGSYDLNFGTDHITGTFTAPRAAVAGSMDYSDCPTRPSQQTCISG